MMPNIAAGAPAAARRVLVTRRTSVACAAFIVALGALWELWLAPTGSGTLAIKVLPLALVLPGLAHGRLRTYRATSLLVWLYAAEGATRALTDTSWSALLAVLELGLSLALFAALVLHVRQRGHDTAAAAT